MKKLFKMLSLICVLTLTVAAFSVLATAATSASYDEGDILEVSTRVENFLALETDAERVALAKELNAYLFSNVIGVRYSQAVYAKIYGEMRCEDCKDAKYACDNCAGKMTPYAQYKYERYQSLIEKIMAYGAVVLIDSYDATAHNYEQKTLSNWVSRMLEHDVGGYTKSEILADDFFAEFDSDAYTTVEFSLDTESGTAVYTVTALNPGKDAIEIAVSEILNTAMVDSITKVEINGEVITSDDYTYDAVSGTLSIAKLAVPGAQYAVNAETERAEMTAGEATVTVSVTVKEGYEAPAQQDTESDGEVEAEPTLKELAEELYAKVDAVLAESLDVLSSGALDEYVYSTIYYNPDYRTNHTKYIANYANATWYGTMYEDGYRTDVLMPKYNQTLIDGKFVGVASGAGKYDLIEKGDYVIFDEGVETYYVSTAKGLIEAEVKRNYVYNEVDGGFVKVADGKGIYDLYDYDFKGYGMLLPYEYFLHIDMTGNTMTSNRPYNNMAGSNTGGITTMVMQTDITHFSTKGHLAFYPYVWYNNGASYGGTSVFTMENGHLYMSSAGVGADGKSYKGNELVIKDVIVPGKWTNVAVVLNVNKGVYDIYVDYEYVYSAKIAQSNVTGYYSVRAQVFGDGTGVSRGCSFKNTYVYQGTAPRDLSKFDSMSVAERFAYYGEHVSDSENTTPSRIYAYSQMQINASTYFVPDEDYMGSHVGVDENGNPILVGGTVKTVDENVINALIQFYSFDYDALLSTYKAENTAAYAEVIKSLTEATRRYSTITARNQAIKDIDKFLLPYQNSEGELVYIDTDSDVYKDAKAKYDKAVAQLAADEASYEFVKVMESYNGSGIYNKKLSFYERAVELMKTTIFDDTITDAGETRLEEAYAIYDRCPEELEAMVYKQNSKYLVMYIDYTMSFDTVESWEENYNHLSYPVSKAREIIKTGKYDVNYTEGTPGTDSYKSLAELLEWYELINDYFFAALQQEHIDYIIELQTKYTETESYMEKLGICNEIKRYTESADIDFNNAQVQILLQKNEEYLAEVDGLEESYIAQRNKRTELFVSVIKKLDVSEGYNEMKALLDEAVSYYYTMTVGATDVITDEQITEAINKYNYYIEYEKKVVESSADFEIIVAGLDDATTYAEYYTVLAEVQPLLDYVSKDIEGVRAAYDKYEMAYNSYMSITSPAKAEIQETQGSVISLRTGYCVSEILAIFAELVGSIVD